MTNKDNIIKSIFDYDVDLLQKSISQKFVNKKIFNIFDDDNEPLWSPLIRVSTLLNKRAHDERYFGIETKFNCADDCFLAKVLLDNGADINERDRNGNTALMYCAIYGNTPLLLLLLVNGADVNLQDNNGNTALVLSYNSGHNTISNILISKGTDKNIINLNGESYQSMIDYDKRKRVY